ncbi:porin [Piscinibacter sp. HJYY11]|nr:porin [Piscinibacter sp. HJYY11]
MQTLAAAAATLAGFAGNAFAQSTVTLFGIVDAGVSQIKNGSESRKLQSVDGLSSSRLGFRGIEDLGGGLSAGFHLEGALVPDTGNPSGYNFQRRSTVSLMHKSVGELRLGRDYVPTFWNLSAFSPFGTNGVGASGLLFYGFGGSSSTAPTIVRSNNSIGYFLPRDLGGVYGQAMVAAAEGAATGKYVGARVGFATGPFDAAVAASEVTNNAAGDKFKSFNAGTSYNFGFLKLMALYSTSKQTTTEQVTWLLGVTAPVGSGEIRAVYMDADRKNSGNDGTLMALGYVHNLSKRTALYGQAGRIKNEGGATFSYGGPTQPAGRPSTAIEAGIRHSF